MKAQYWLWLSILLAVGTIIRLITLFFSDIFILDILNVILGAALSYFTWYQYKKMS